MKHIEVSRKIDLSRPVSASELKDAFVERLEKVLEIETLTDGDERFSVSGTTGSPAGITRHARLDLDVSIRYDDNNIVRILVSGHSRTARSLVFMYSFLFVLLLFVGLLPGSVSTHAEAAGPMDALVFLIFGIFIIFDINNKIGEPKEYLETVLESLDTQFG